MNLYGYFDVRKKNNKVGKEEVENRNNIHMTFYKKS